MNTTIVVNMATTAQKCPEDDHSVLQDHCEDIMLTQAITSEVKEN